MSDVPATIFSILKVTQKFPLFPPPPIYVSPLSQVPLVGIFIFKYTFPLIIFLSRPVTLFLKHYLRLSHFSLFCIICSTCSPPLYLSLSYFHSRILKEDKTYAGNWPGGFRCVRLKCKYLGELELPLYGLC